MAHTNGSQPVAYTVVNNDEVDLGELFNKIWQGRLLIAAIVISSAVCAYVALKLSPSYYKIEATVDALPADQLRALFPSVLEAKEYQVPAPDEKKIYGKVLLQIGSLSSLRTYWEAKTGKALPDRKEDIKSNEDRENLREFKKFVSVLYLEPANAKTVDVTARKISLEHTSRALGVAMLKEYLAFSAQQVLSEQIQQMNLSFEASLKSLDVNYTNRAKIEERKLNDTLINLRESLKIAESLGIKETPFKDLENIQLKVLDGQGYLLGTKTIAQQIGILSARQGKSLAPFSSDLRNMENWRIQMESDLERIKELDGKLQLFSVVNPPEATFDPIKPNKMLILIGVIFVSVILSIFIVLVRSALAERKTMEQV